MNSFLPPQRPTKPISAKTQPKGILDTLNEKDDLLLYFTAFLGVVMPGIVYLIYHKLHTIYSRWAAKKDAERIKDEREKAEIGIFYASLDEKSGRAATRAAELKVAMGDENPQVHSLSSMEIDVFAKFKGFGVFIIESLPGGGTIEKTEWFYEWLEDIAADAKQKKRTCVEHVKFTVIGLASSLNSSSEAQFGKAARTLHKRLKIVGAKEISNLAILDTDLEDVEANRRFQNWAIETMEAIDGNLPTGSDQESVFTESTCDLSDLDDLDDTKKDR